MIAIFGSLGGLVLLCFGVWFLVIDIEGNESILAHVGVLLIAIAVPVYGIGAEMIGEIRGRSSKSGSWE